MKRMIVLFAMVMSGSIYAASANDSSADYSEIYAMLKLASKQYITVGRFQYTHKTIIDPIQNKETTPVERAKEFESKLRNDIETGQYFVDEASLSKLEKRYGTREYTELLGNPEVAAVFEEYVREGVQDFLKTDLLTYGKKEYYTQKVKYIDYPKGVYTETSFDKMVLDGVVDDSWSDRKQFHVMLPDCKKTYTPKYKSGMIDHGFAKNRSRIASQIEYPNLLVAGRPIIKYSSDQLISVEKDTTKGDQLKIVFTKEIQPGAGYTTVMWVRSDMDYVVTCQEDYENGVLYLRREFGDFKEIEPGLYYPMHQTQKEYKGKLPTDIREKLDKGELELYSDKVLKNQMLHLEYEYSNDIEEVEHNIIIPEKMYSLSFPPNTRIVDHRIKSKDGQPLTFQLDLSDDVLGDPFKVPESDTKPSLKTSLQESKTIIERAITTSDIGNKSNVKENADVAVNADSNAGDSNLGWLFITGIFCVVAVFMGFLVIYKYKRK